MHGFFLIPAFKFYAFGEKNLHDPEMKNQVEDEDDSA